VSLKVVVNKTTNKVEVTSPGPQGNFYNSFKGNWSSATAYFVGDIVFYDGSSYVATANSTNSQPPSASWAAVAKGIPGGGTSGQIIVKNSSTDYDYSWTNNYSIATTSPLTGGAAINTNPTLSIADATTAVKGAVQLTDSTSSTSTTTAATPNSVKSAYDLANTANTTANAAAPKTTTISTTAPLSGGGDLSANRTLSIADATTSVKGAVQLTDSTSSTSTTTAATPNSVKSAYDLADAAAPKTTTIGATAPITSSGTLGTGVTIAVSAATTAAAGVVQLTDSISSTSTTTAATPNSVKSAYDLANAAIPLAQKAAANGVATLDGNSLVPTNQLPALAITNTFVVASEAAMLALTAETGDVAVRTDVSKSFILTATPASTLANWQELLTPPDAVTSVDGRSGVVSLSDLYAARGTTISTTSPLTGGGDLSANRTFAIDDATTAQKGAVQLSSLTNSTSEILAATPKAVKDTYDLAAAAVPQTRTISTTAPLTGGGALTGNLTLAASAASTSAAGVVQLSTSVTSTSQTLAATVSAVKTAYDFADEIQTRVIMEAI
jgi:phage-related tail fiber protein